MPWKLDQCGVFMESKRAGNPKVGEIDLCTQQKRDVTEGGESRYSKIDECGRSCSFDNRGEQ
jgi:hypothetical protein